jgi:hypothetical protein
MAEKANADCDQEGKQVDGNQSESVKRQHRTQLIIGMERQKLTKNQSR